MDVEVRVFSGRKEGLLRALGSVLIECGFTLLRQRMASTPSGVELWLRLSGEYGRLLELEDKLISHPLVSSFEANHQPLPGDAAPASDRTPQSPSRVTPDARAAAPRSMPGFEPATPSSTVARRRGSTTGPAIDIAEPVLPKLAKSYPKIFPQLLELQRQVSEAQWGPSLKFIGTRVGAWVYKRDYAFGGQLDLRGALRQIALPAMRALLPAEVKDYALHIKNNPFCLPGSHCRNGDFFCGFLQGLLQEAGVSSGLVVREVRCRAEGASACVFEVVD